jgi:hypothetical protein
MSLFEHTAIVAAEDASRSKLLAAFLTSHKRGLVNSGDEELVLDAEGAGLSAVCHSARICWAHFLCDELGRYFSYDDATKTTNKRVFFFTLVDVGCARSLDEHKVDLNPIARKLSKGLRGYNFIGVIEPGLYSHIDAESPYGPSCVSWHMHVLLWKTSRKHAKRLAKRLNKSKKYIPLSPGQDGVFQRQVREGELSQALGYILKPPKSAYRLGRRRESTDAKPSFIQYRSKLRPGERLTLYLQMRHLSLPEMWIAGGKGSALLGMVKRRSRAAVRRFERLSNLGNADRRRSVLRHSSLLSTIHAAKSRKSIL